MKKKLIMTAIALLLCCTTRIFAEEAPIGSGGWYYEGGIKLNGSRFVDMEDYRM